MGLTAASCVVNINGEIPSDDFAVRALGKVAEAMHYENIVICNQMELKMMEFPGNIAHFKGCGILLFGSLFNHSCDPNVQSFLVYCILKPVKENEQLFVSYWYDF